MTDADALAAIERLLSRVPVWLPHKGYLALPDRVAMVVAEANDRRLDALYSSIHSYLETTRLESERDEARALARQAMDVGLGMIETLRDQLEASHIRERALWQALVAAREKLNPTPGES